MKIMIYSLLLGLGSLYFLWKSQKALVPVKQPTQLEILRRRYLAGQITKEEYMYMVELLK